MVAGMAPPWLCSQPRSPGTEQGPGAVQDPPPAEPFQRPLRAAGQNWGSQRCSLCQGCGQSCSTSLFFVPNSAGLGLQV